MSRSRDGDCVACVEVVVPSRRDFTLRKVTSACSCVCRDLRACHSAFIGCRDCIRALHRLHRSPDIFLYENIRGTKGGKETGSSLVFVRASDVLSYVFVIHCSVGCKNHC